MSSNQATPGGSTTFAKPRSTVHRFAALSVIKHAYVPLSMASHPGFTPVVVADHADVPEWAHERNQLLADQFGVPYVRDVDEALHAFDVSVAVVSSEAERHCELSIRAANAGKHVVQDKPMSTSLAECDRLVEAIERNDVRFMMWNRNGLPAVIKAAEAVRTGVVGELKAVHVDFYFSKDAGPRKGTRQPGFPPINWLDRQVEAHHDGSDGGVGKDAMGELAVEGIYPLAYIRMITGQDVRNVFAVTMSHFHQAHADNDVDDLASVTLEMDGVVGSMAIGRIGAASHPNIGEIKIHLIGTKGALVVDEPRPEVSVYYRGQPQFEFRQRRVCNENDFLLAENFYEAIRTGSETMLDVRASRDICATVTAAVRSGRTGEREPVDLLA